MKKNKSLVLLMVLIALGQMGFDWGAPTGEKKNASGRANASAAANQNNVPANLAQIPFPQMMGALSQNLTLWSLLTPENKLKAVEAAIVYYRDRQNIAILQPAELYVDQINQGLGANPALQGSDIMATMKMMAVMQYDFYNGQDKDQLAKEVLGEKLYETVRARRK